jgi:hypothetical protein
MSKKLLYAGITLTVVISFVAGCFLGPKILTTRKDDTKQSLGGYGSYGLMGKYVTSTTDFLTGGQGSALMVDSMGRLIISTSTLITVTSQ